jgi:hypothetical protein
MPASSQCKRSRSQRMNAELQPQHYAASERLAGGTGARSLRAFAGVTSQYSLMALSARGMPFGSPLAINRRKTPKQVSR